jgi:NAD(P)-dependent dehydrogenase (short-subunit alcohol dehydrogenase family)
VTVSSLGHRARAAIDFDDLQSERHYDRFAAYGQSKLANLLFTYELQRRLARNGELTIAVAAHPGSSRTDLGRNSPAWLRISFTALGPLIFQSPQMGALPTLRAATDPTVRGGQYYGRICRTTRLPDMRSILCAIARRIGATAALDGLRGTHWGHVSGVNPRPLVRFV